MTARLNRRRLTQQGRIVVLKNKRGVVSRIRFPIRPRVSRTQIASRIVRRPILHPCFPLPLPWPLSAVGRHQNPFVEQWVIPAMWIAFEVCHARRKSTWRSPSPRGHWLATFMLPIRQQRHPNHRDMQSGSKLLLVEVEELPRGFGQRRHNLYFDPLPPQGLLHVENNLNASRNHVLTAHPHSMVLAVDKSLRGIEFVSEDGLPVQSLLKLPVDQQPHPARTRKRFSIRRRSRVRGPEADPWAVARKQVERRMPLVDGIDQRLRARVPHWRTRRKPQDIASIAEMKEPHGLFLPQDYAASDFDRT